MSITTYRAPEGAAKIVAKTLRNLGYVSTEPTGSGSQETTGVAESSAHESAGTEHVELTSPLVVRTVPASALTKQNCFEYATVTGWRYLAPQSEAMVDFNADHNRTGTISTGPILEKLEKAVQLAADEFGNKPGTYQVGILEVPALRTAALTIEGDNEAGKNQKLYFIPYKDPRPTQEIKVATVNSFARQLADILGLIAPGSMDTSNLQHLESAELAPVESQQRPPTSADTSSGSPLQRLGKALPAMAEVAGTASAVAGALRASMNKSQQEFNRTFKNVPFLKSMQCSYLWFCVEVAYKDGLVGVRNSGDPTNTMVVFSKEEWRAFLEGVRRGEFDFPE
jgi:hypothetical protein